MDSPAAEARSPALAVVCRQDQMVAAALVLSCVPRERQVLLLVQEPEPHSYAEYRERFARFHQLFEERNQLIGGGIGWSAAGDARLSRLADLQGRVDSALIELMPYRSWHAHQRGLRAIAQRLAPGAALLLLATDDAALTLNGVTEQEIAAGESATLLPAQTRLDSLGMATDARPEDWVQAAWRYFRPGEELPSQRIEFAADDPAHCLCALRESLRCGHPLQAVTAAGPQPPLHQTAVMPNASAEVVVIEAAEQADLLLGVLYAYSRGLGVVAFPRPDRTAVDRALAEMEAERIAASKDLQSMLEAGVDAEGSRHEDRSKLFGRLRSWLIARRAGALDRLAQAVTDAVPQQVPQIVGAAPLTALTGGIPYRFVRHAGGDWADKPIGHIVGDRALLLLNVLHPPAIDAAATFDMLFDPGFFDTEETRDVLNALAGRRSYALVLRGAAGSSTSLLHLSNSLPVELIYFNTHGADDSILLSDRPIPSFKLGQWLRLPSRPVVFNSSCLSWIGVGTEFVRCGAQGYVGTLWSVDAEQAGDLARQALQRMVRGGATCCESLCRTGVDPLTSMAYLFVGTASQRLLGAEQRQGDDADRARSHATSLLSVARGILDSHGLMRDEDHRRATVLLLLTEASRMVDDVLALDPAAAATLELLLLRIDVIHMLPATEVRTRLGELLDDAERRCRALEPASPLVWRLVRQRAQWLLEGGETMKALAHALGGTVPADAADADAASLEWLRSDLHKMASAPEAALQAAQRALAINRRVAGDNRSGVMGSLGRVVQASLRLPARRSEALQAAHEGLKLARELGHESEQLVFELDIARVHRASGEPELGEPYARAAVARARRNFDNLGELSAVGTLCSILVDLNRLDEAAASAKAGLDEATKLRQMTSVADFHMNLATIEQRRGQPEEAFGHLIEAARLFSEHGPPERLRGVSQWANAWVAGHGGADGQLRLVELMFVVALQGDDQAVHWPIAAQGVRTLLQWAQARTQAPPVATLVGLLGHEARGRKSEPGMLLSMAIRCIAACAAGDKNKAAEWAAHLDRLTNSHEFSDATNALLGRWGVDSEGRSRPPKNTD